MSTPSGTDAPEPIIDGGELLEELHNRITDYVVLPSPEAAVAVTLWIAATHAQQAWQHATRLRVGSPLKRCGKTRLLDVIENTCHRPVSTVDATIAALFRSIDPGDPPTLIVDEADAIWSKKSNDQTEDLRKLLNSGFGRGRYVLRCVGPTQEVRQFATFAMCAIAGIGDMPDTITDRAVNIIMRRRANGETVKPFRVGRDAPQLHELRSRVAAWLAPQIDELRAAVPDMPVEDRAADVWEPLLAIADAVGGVWPEYARVACTKLSSESDAADLERALSLQLLADLRAIFLDEERLATKEILERLRRLDGAPWSDWYGRLFNARDLAGMLRDYGILAVNVKLAGRVLKGYRRDHLHKMGWAPYLPVEEDELDEPSHESATSATSATSLTNNGFQVADEKGDPLPPLPDLEGGSGGSLSRFSSATSDRLQIRKVAEVAQVAEIREGKRRQEYGTCARCGERMTITEDGQTTHPGCEVTQ